MDLKGLLALVSNRIISFRPLTDSAYLLMCKLQRAHPVAHAGSLILTEKMLVGRAKEKIRHPGNVIFSTAAAAARVLILSISQAATQWKQQISICRTGSTGRVVIRDSRKSWVNKTGHFAFWLTMGKGTWLPPPESTDLTEHKIPWYPLKQTFAISVSVWRKLQDTFMPKPITNCENTALQLSQPCT